MDDDLVTPQRKGKKKYGKPGRPKKHQKGSGTVGRPRKHERNDASPRPRLRAHRNRFVAEPSDRTTRSAAGLLPAPNYADHRTYRPRRASAHRGPNPIAESDDEEEDLEANEDAEDDEADEDEPGEDDEIDVDDEVDQEIQDNQDNQGQEDQRPPSPSSADEGRESEDDVQEPQPQGIEDQSRREHHHPIPMIELSTTDEDGGDEENAREVHFALDGPRAFFVLYWLEGLGPLRNQHPNPVEDVGRKRTWEDVSSSDDEDRRERPRKQRRVKSPATENPQVYVFWYRQNKGPIRSRLNIGKLLRAAIQKGNDQRYTVENIFPPPYTPKFARQIQRDQGWEGWVNRHEGRPWKEAEDRPDEPQFFRKPLGQLVQGLDHPGWTPESEDVHAIQDGPTPKLFTHH
ncbi:hypothetical protein M426DRAFT_13240 [Hypoxylon sp. CI-4A]|nr:hypothetical protein M426DRAFT_13240 [Hypoxylon sp. CI-4A]